MALTLTNKDIKEYLQEGLEEEGSIEKAFDYLLKSEIRDLFEMDAFDEPKFTELIIKFNKIKYNIIIIPDGCCESTNDHRIMYWTWNIDVM